ncbi:MAG: DUF1552 domain-containing protein [Rhodospirillaceae bacterium]
MNQAMKRRAVLRGTLAGMAVCVPLPFLDCVLDGNGAALATTGESLPVVFGTWFQPLGFNPGRWIPDTVGAGYRSKPELKALDRFKDRMNLISGTKYFLDGRPNETHITGTQIAMSGAIPVGNVSAPSIDNLVADAIGTRTRFRSLEVNLDGTRRSISTRAGAASRTPAEPSPAALYARIFGPEFKDPNAADFTPEASVIARKSVLSAVGEARKAFMSGLGGSDKARLDEYFTSVRQIEQQLDLELQKPAPLKDCTRAESPNEANVGALVTDVEQNSALFGALLAHAVACGQTRVFNVLVAEGTGALRRAGSTETWHGWTHEEPIDEKLGYQPQVTWFIEWATATFAQFLGKLEALKEGSGSVLDRMVILWQTDHGIARSHTMDNLPIIAVGNAGGRLKTGLHISAAGDPSTRVGLTLQQALGVPVNSWGALSNATSKTFTEILA